MADVTTYPVVVTVLDSSTTFNLKNVSFGSLDAWYSGTSPSSIKIYTKTTSVTIPIYTVERDVRQTTAPFYVTHELQAWLARRMKSPKHYAANT